MPLLSYIPAMEGETITYALTAVPTGDCRMSWNFDPRIFIIITTKSKIFNFTSYASNSYYMPAAVLVSGNLFALFW